MYSGRTCVSLKNRPILSLISGRRKTAPVLGLAWGSFFSSCAIRLRTPELYLDMAEGKLCFQAKPLVISTARRLHARDGRPLPSSTGPQRPATETFKRKLVG